MSSEKIANYYNINKNLEYIGLEIENYILQEIHFTAIFDSGSDISIITIKALDGLKILNLGATSKMNSKKYFIKINLKID